MQDTSCYHCGEPIPKGHHFSVEVNGESHALCCRGCEAVAHAIINGGLDSYYQFRTQMPERPEGETHLSEADLSIFDRPELQARFVHQDEQGQCDTQLAIDGMTCAACAWLIEHHIGRLDGVISLLVNVSDHRARLVWDPAQTQLSQILTELQQIGYPSRPYQPDQHQQQLEYEQRMATRRLIVAAIGMMQVMMFASALYVGAFDGIDDSFKALFRWLSLALTTPVVFFSARPFFTAAWRDLKTRHLTMDVPVSLAIGLAYSASVYATVTHGPEVYFDSVVMFTFFLLFGRYIEMRTRHRIGRGGNRLDTLLPSSAIRLTQNGDHWIEEVVTAEMLEPGDRIRVRSGQTLPADGTVVTGHSSINEAALTGEYMPVPRQPGDQVMAGTQNIDSPLDIEVTQAAAQSRVSDIMRLMDRALEEKPRVAAIASHLAHYVVLGVLILATGTYSVWWWLGSDHAFWIALSVLVATCPCALSLATPTSLTVANNHLRQRGLLVTRGHVLEALAKVDTLILDKTGTITEGRLHLSQTQLLPLATESISQDELIRWAASLEVQSNHPIATAFKELNEQAPLATRQLEVVTGQGIKGEVRDALGQWHTLRLGRPDFAWPQASLERPRSEGLWLLMANAQGPLCWFNLSDRLRADAIEAVQALQQQGLTLELLSGDHPAHVAHIAQTLGLAHYQGHATPETKLARLKQLQSEGHQVAMVGDGINDVPVLAGAQVSIAMGQATDLARTSADALLVSSHLLRLAEARHLALKTQQIIRQNLGLSLCYNLSIVPLAAVGWVPPWLAAIGMSLSSLMVLFNALRLRYREQASSPVMEAHTV